VGRSRWRAMKNKAGSQQIGPSRLYVPGGPGPGAPPPGGQIVVKGPKGEPMSLPIVYVGALDQSAANQIYQIARSAVADAVQDIVRGLSATIVQALTPKATSSDPVAPPGAGEPQGEPQGEPSGGEEQAEPSGGEENVAPEPVEQIVELPADPVERE
jgi:hypothetical protein